MADYITIDGGTTNTRLCLVSDGRILDTVKAQVGAGAMNTGLLKETVRKGIEELLKRNHKSETDITRILASGMITSEFGLINLPHITVPAGIRELHDSMAEVVLEEISQIPFVFVRGVKTLCDCIEAADMMRGEETELQGLWENGDGLLVLPGSHSKLIQLDAQGRIVKFQTMLTGEMISALSQGTILKDAVKLQEYEEDPKFLWKGYELCRNQGLNAALFKVRVLKNLFGKDSGQVYHFFLGMVLCEEINAILECCPAKIVIGGKGVIREPMAYLLRRLTSAEVVTVLPERAEAASAMGVIRIYEYRS